MKPQTLSVKTLRQRTIDYSYKGLPEAAQGMTFERFLSTHPNIFTSGFRFPLATLRKSALDNNLIRMAKYCEEVGASLAPHLKTTMSPQIAQMQVEQGAWALTLANFSQARVFLDYGFQRIIIANEVVDKGTIREIGVKNFNYETEIIFYIDSLAGLAIIQEALEGVANAQILLLIEIGFEGGRGGIRNDSDVKVLAEQIAKDSRLSLLGVSGFEGIVTGVDRTIEGLEGLRVFCRKIVSAAKSVVPFIKNEKIIITAGGSGYFDIVVEEFSKFNAPYHLVLRSGGYITHDHGSYERIYPFAQMPTTKQLLPAIEVWAQVLTQPEVGFALLNLGKRDVGIDIDQPFPVKKFHQSLQSFNGRIDHLNDQHGYLHFSEDQEVSVGDVIGLGISHPCTTLDKWRVFALVDDNYDVVDFIHTFF